MPYTYAPPESTATGRESPALGVGTLRNWLVVAGGGQLRSLHRWVARR